MSTAPAPLASPCIGVCRMDSATGWCTGCLRTLDEIACWSQWGDVDRRAVWLALGARRVEWRRRNKDAHLQDATGGGAAPGPA